MGRRHHGSPVCGHPCCARPITWTGHCWEHLWRGRPVGPAGIVLGPAGMLIGHLATPPATDGEGT